jgi:tetratricopeptide (TPR) repeat protein
LAVEFIVDMAGLEGLRRVLLDLAQGMNVNDALEREVGSLSILEPKFEDFVRQRAEDLAAEVDWEEPDLAEDEEPRARPSAQEWLADHPDSFWALLERGQELAAEENWEAAKEPLARVIRLVPEYVGADNAYRLLAIVHRELGEHELEKQALLAWAERDADALEAYARLVEIGVSEEKWEMVVENARRHLAVNPLIEAPHRYLARAAEELGDFATASDAYRAVLVFDPVDPAEVHYRLANAMYRGRSTSSDERNLDEAKRQVLLALAEAPRFRAAQGLLLEIVGQAQAAPDLEEAARNDEEVAPTPSPAIPATAPPRTP